MNKEEIYLLETAEMRKNKLKAEKILGRKIKTPYYLEDINKIIEGKGKEEQE